MLRRCGLQRLSQCSNSTQRVTKGQRRIISRMVANANNEPNILKSPYEDIEVPKLTIPEFVWQNLHKWADRTAVVCGVSGRGYTYNQAFRMSKAFAANLRLRLRLRDGDCVALMMPNIPEYPLVALGALQAGAILTTINPIYTPHEIQRQLLLSDTKVVVTSAGKAGVVLEALQLAKLDLPIIVIKGPEESTPPGSILFSEFTEDLSVDTDCLREVRRGYEDIAALPYSSGTTGLPKGVMLEHRNILANCEQVNEELVRVSEETTASHQDTILAVLPFFHIYGMVVVMFEKLSRGCKLVTLPSFQVDTYLDAIVRNHVSVIYAAPPIVLFMATHQDVAAEHYEYINAIVSGAAPLPVADITRLFEKAKREFAFIEGFGLTESSPVVCMTRKKEKSYGTTGYPLPNTDVKMVGPDGEALGPDKSGELLVRGPQVMRGYHNNDAANEEVFAGGWLRTGDLASYNAAGQITISGRLKELIKVKGYQVPPAELEALLREHPEVADAAVVGAPHPTHGEVPRAFVVCRPGGGSLDPDQLKQYVAERVAPYKRIVHLQFIDAVPKNASGKIMRKELEKMKID